LQPGAAPAIQLFSWRNVDANSPASTFSKCDPAGAAEGGGAGRAGHVLVEDALTLKDWTERFDNVIDSGLFHVFGDEDRRRYVEGLAMVLKPGARLFLLCLSDEEPGEQGPRRVSQAELHVAFAGGWASSPSSRCGSKSGPTSRSSASATVVRRHGL
jgi:cyclopropane fatty-acyl-phospholipid synthase-like methyltransferase